MYRRYTIRCGGIDQSDKPAKIAAYAIFPYSRFEFTGTKTHTLDTRLAVTLNGSVSGIFRLSGETQITPSIV